MTISKKQQASVHKYVREHYDRISVNVPQGMRDVIKAHAAEFDGGSVNAFICRAIEEQMKRDREA